MGLGGYLCWTATARELRKRLPKGVKIMPIEQHGQFIKTIKNSIFYNNEDIVQEWEKDVFTFPMVLNNPSSNYCKKDTPQYAVHRHDKHIIEQYCEFYGIENPELKCKIRLDKKEQEKVDSLESKVGSNRFVTIDIGVNKNYNSNKFDNFDAWQKIVDKVSKEIKVVQIGLKQPHLDNTTNMTEMTTFREAAGLIGKSKLFIGNEGGLVHAASAFDTPCVAIMTSFIHPDLVKYKQNEYIWLNDDKHGPCGMKVKCENCHENMKKINTSQVIEKIIEKI